jgi:hypothetical protein
MIVGGKDSNISLVHNQLYLLKICEGIKRGDFWLNSRDELDSGYGVNPGRVLLISESGWVRRRDGVR